MKRSSLKEVLFVLTLAVAFFVLSAPVMAVDPGGRITKDGEHPWGGDGRTIPPTSVTSSVVPAVDNPLGDGSGDVPLFTPPGSRYNPLLPFITLDESGWCVIDPRR